ncbi:tapasin isoform X2 [Haliaeetus albicilla]|uniref:tapasin isoform X2 n=1 Tax=Haliaeetus albicilla TaxID=8969 RepID=UPI0037E9A689
MAAIAVLGRLLAGLCLLGWGAADVGTPPAPPPPLPCTLLGPGERGMLPGAVSQRPALLRFWGGPETPPNPDTSQDQDPDMTFDVTAALSVFTITPDLGGSPGAALELHCAFAAPPGPFALEWRHQDRGAGRVLLTYDSATSRVPKATPGVQLLLGTTEGGVREVTLRLAPLAVAHQGTYICSIFLPHGQGQQLLRVRILEPPKVTLHPTPLVVAPGMTAELWCDTSGYFPLDVEVRWQRRASGSGTPLPLGDTVTETWTSGHRRGPDGTFSRSSGIRLVPTRPHHHGDVYTCVVTHAAVTNPLRVRVQLEVAGATGPWLEDVAGLCLVAFVLCGLCRWLSPAPPCLDQEHKKTQ